MASSSRTLQSSWFSPLALFGLLERPGTAREVVNTKSWVNLAVPPSIQSQSDSENSDLVSLWSKLQCHVEKGANSS